MIRFIWVMHFLASYLTNFETICQDENDCCGVCFGYITGWKIIVSWTIRSPLIITSLFINRLSHFLQWMRLAQIFVKMFLIWKRISILWFGDLFSLTLTPFLQFWKIKIREKIFFTFFSSSLQQRFWRKELLNNSFKMTDSINKNNK